MKSFLFLLVFVPSILRASPTIMIVDSTAGSAAYQAIGREIPDANVLEVESGSHAVKRLESFLPDVIIIAGDLGGTPGPNGWQTLAKIQNEKPGIPIIRISALDPEKAKQQIEAAGAKFPQGYFQTPFKDEDLVSLVRKLSGTP